MTREQLAAEAERIRKNDAASHALSLMRAAAMAQLAVADPTDADEIRKFQAQIRAVDEFFSTLDGVIADGAPKKRPGIA